VERIAWVVSFIVLAGACSSSHRSATRQSTTNPSSPTSTVEPAAGFLSAKYGSTVRGFSVWNWNGQQVATVQTNFTTECCGLGSVSPDGTRLLLFDYTSDTKPQAEVLDIHGRVLAKFAVLGVQIWADDSRHLCELRRHDSNERFAGMDDLILIDPGHGQRVIAQAGGYGPHSEAVILQCSIADNEAIVANQSTDQYTSITGVRLNTSRTYKPKWVPRAADGQTYAISGNGRYALVPSGNGPFSVAIIDTTTDAIVGHTSGQVFGMSWDGHLVLESVNALDLQVVDWRTGAVLWHSGDQTGEGVTGAQLVARPNSDDLALAVADIPGHDPHSGALWLIMTTQPPKLLDNAIVPGVI